MEDHAELQGISTDRHSNSYPQIAQKDDSSEGEDPFSSPNDPSEGEDPFSSPHDPSEGEDPFSSSHDPSEGEDPFFSPHDPSEGGGPFSSPHDPSEGEDPFSSPHDPSIPLFASESEDTASQYSQSDLEYSNSNQEEEGGQEEEEEAGSEAYQTHPPTRTNLSESHKKEPEVAGHRPKDLIKRALAKIRSIFSTRHKFKFKKPKLTGSVPSAL
ncbi:ATPase AAA domain-containing protein 2B [Lobaria immixta]|nr:ATPase AAA domain-containing protein 2B [Lobaria immixta]